MGNKPTTTKKSKPQLLFHSMPPEPPENQILPSSKTIDVIFKPQNDKSSEIMTNPLRKSEKLHENGLTNFRESFKRQKKQVIL